MTDLTSSSAAIAPARLAVLVAAADAGPWVIEHEGSEAWIHAANGFHVACVYDRASDGSGEPQFDEACEAHAALIALAPALAARVIELEAENARLREALERVVEITEDNKLDQTAALVAALNVAQDGLSGRDAYAEYVAALEARHD